jgi:hypothetical protein
MKTWTFAKWGRTLGAAILLAAGVLSGVAEGQAPRAEGPADAQPAAGSAVTNLGEVVGGQSLDMNLANAPAQPVSTERSLPPNIRPSVPLTEVIRLAESGVAEGVMLSYITNSASTFNLTAEEIIYLNDIGVPGAVITAMIQRDQALKEVANASVPAVASPPPAPVFAGPQPTLESAPQPEVAPVENPYPAPPPSAGATDVEFYDALAPYGTWLNVGGYGLCWQPTVAAVNVGWQPYFNCGRWVYTDCGWYWLSDYSWGWAPFHYGRWFRHNQFGWCWAPDRVWGPSWVCWRYSDAYCGWAPLPPFTTYQAGLGLCYGGNPVGFNFGFGLGISCYAFVPIGHFCDHNLYAHAVPPHNRNYVYHQTVAATRFVAHNRTVINQGVPAERVALASRTEVRRVNIHTVNNPNALGGVRGDRLTGGGSTLTVVRRPTAQPIGNPAPRTTGSSQTPENHYGRSGGSPMIAPGSTSPRSSGDLANTGRNPTRFGVPNSGAVTRSEPLRSTHPSGTAVGGQAYSSRPAPIIMRGGDRTTAAAPANSSANAWWRPAPTAQPSLPAAGANRSWQSPSQGHSQSQSRWEAESMRTPSSTPAPREFSSPRFQAPPRAAEGPRYTPMPAQQRQHFEVPSQRTPRSFSPGAARQAAPQHYAPSPPAHVTPSAPSHSSTSGGRSFGNTSGRNGR